MFVALYQDYSYHQQQVEEQKEEEEEAVQKRLKSVYCFFALHY